MSQCISRHGEYSEHDLDETGEHEFTCKRCWVFDEDAALSALRRARSLAAALEQESALKDEALAELRKVVDHWGLITINPNTHTRLVIRDCEREIRPILSSLAARLDAHLFPTDEEGASDE